MNITVIGAGGWGTALAIQALKKNNVKIWSFLKEEADLFREKKENVYYLPGVPLPDMLEITCDAEYAVKGADILLFVPPSKFFRSVAKQFASIAPKNAVLVSATKGIEFPS